MSAAGLVIASLLLLATTLDLPLPRYDMAWGEFSHRLALYAPAALSPASPRVALVGAALVLALLALSRALVRLAALTGKRFALFLAVLLLASGATLVPLPRPGAPADPATLLYALRALAVCLLVAGTGSLLFRRLPGPLRVRLWDAADRAIGSPWFVRSTAAFAALGVLVVAWVRLDAIPHAMDEITQIFQARIYASGRLWAQPPPLPDLIGHFSLLTEGGKWRSAAPPGHALAMAPFVAAGLLPLYPPLITALTVAAVFALVSRTDDRRTAALAVVLLLASPWFWSMGASYMSHLPVALWLACFLACFIRAREGSLAAAAGAGLFLGVAAATREADALLLTAPFGVLWLLDVFQPDRRPGWLARSGAMAVCLAPGLAFLLVTNTLANGGPFVFGHDVLFGGPLRFGLGPAPAILQSDPLSASVSGFRGGLTNLRGLLTDLQVVLFGLGLPSLAIVALALHAPARDGRVFAALAALALFLGAYAFFPVDMTMFGPRYAFGALPLLVWLGARGVVSVHRRLAAVGQAHAVGGILALGALLAFTREIPAALGSFHRDFAGVDRRLERALDGAGAREAIIAVLYDPRDVRGNPFLYTSAFRLMQPDLRGLVAFADWRRRSIDDAMESFADRPAYAWFAVYRGPFYDPRFVTASLLRLYRPSDPGFRPEREAAARHALEVFRGARGDGIDSAVLWNSLGLIAWLGGDGPGARARYRRAAALAPRDPDPWVNLALIDRADGRLEDARRWALRARDLGARLPPPLDALTAPPRDAGPSVQGGGMGDAGNRADRSRNGKR